MSRLLRTRGLLAAPLLTVLVATPVPASAAPVAATAATPNGATLTLTGAAAKQLRTAKVTVAAGGGAVRTGTRVTTKVTAAQVTTVAATSLAGTLSFRKGKRAVTFTGLRATASAAKITLTGRRGGKKVVLASGRTLGKRLTLDAGTTAVSLSPSALLIGSSAAKALKRTLGLSRTPAGSIGTLQLAVAGTTPTPPTPVVPDPDPPVVAKPADAVDVTGATIVWHVRDSFVQYTASGEGSTVSNGAVADPLSSGCTSTGGVNDAQLPYQFRFPLKSGWYQPSTGRAGLSFTGTVNYRYRAHTIDLNMKNPELDLNGAASRAIFRFSGSDGTNLSDVRAPLLDLTLGAPKPKQCAADPGPTGIDAPTGVLNADGSRTFTFERMPGAVAPEGASTLFSDYGYQAGDPFGWMTVTFTVPAA